MDRRFCFAVAWVDGVWWNKPTGPQLRPRWSAIRVIELAVAEQLSLPSGGSSRFVHWTVDDGRRFQSAVDADGQHNDRETGAGRRTAILPAWRVAHQSVRRARQRWKPA